MLYVLGLLILFFGIVSLGVNNGNANIINENLRKNRELDQERYDLLEQIVKKIEEESQLVDIKIDALSRFVDERNTYVTFQQEQFNSLAKTDMLAARREELFRTKELKIALERLMGVAFISKQPAASQDVLALENVTKRIRELEVILDDK